MTPASGRGRPSSSSANCSGASAALPDLEHRPDQHSDHVAHERVGLDPELEQVVTATTASSADRTSRSKRTCSVSVGVNAVKSWVPRTASAHARSASVIERSRPVQRPSALERASCRARQQPVAVGAAGRVEAGVEARGRRPAVEHGDVVGQQRVERLRRGPADLRSWRPGRGRERRRRCGRRPSASPVRRAARCPAPARARPARCAARAARPSPRSRSRRTRSAGVRPRGGWRGRRGPTRTSDEFEQNHLGRVRPTRPQLQDPRVTAMTLFVARRDLLEQLVDRELVLAERRQRLATGVQIAPLAERDQLLELGLDGLGLGSVVLIRSCSMTSLERFISSDLRCAEDRLSWYR